jgi:hypothetical protein
MMLDGMAAGGKMIDGMATGGMIDRMDTGGMTILRMATV